MPRGSALRATHLCTLHSSRLVRLRTVMCCTLPVPAVDVYSTRQMTQTMAACCAVKSECITVRNVLHCSRVQSVQRVRTAARSSSSTLTRRIRIRDADAKHCTAHELLKATRGFCAVIRSVALHLFTSVLVSRQLLYLRSLLLRSSLVTSRSRQFSSVRSSCASFAAFCLHFT